MRSARANGSASHFLQVKGDRRRRTTHAVRHRRRDGQHERGSWVDEQQRDDDAGEHTAWEETLSTVDDSMRMISEVEVARLAKFCDPHQLFHQLFHGREGLLRRDALLLLLSLRLLLILARRGERSN